VLQGNRKKMPEICFDTVGDRLRGVSSFPMAEDQVENVPIGPTLFFGYFPWCTCYYSISIAEKVSYTLQAFSNESPIPFKYCSNGL
jgi:hypothetical protein